MITPGNIVASMLLLLTVAAIVGAPVGNAVGDSLSSIWRDPTLGAGVWPGNTVGATESWNSGDPVVGSKTIMSTGESVGTSVEMSLTMMQGDSTPVSQMTPDARIAPEQQSKAPLVPAIVPQPTPPH